jgi:hypothetical protein
VNYTGGNPSIMLGARAGQQYYCDYDRDSGVPNSSASNNYDYAQYNVIRYNKIRKRSVSDMIRGDGTYTCSPNTVTNNVTIP